MLFSLFLRNDPERLPYLIFGGTFGIGYRTVWTWSLPGGVHRWGWTYKALPHLQETLFDLGGNVIC